MKRRLAFIIVVLLAFSLSASAVNAQIDITNELVENNIEDQGYVKYQITVTNRQDFSDTIKVRAIDIQYGQLIFPQGNGMTLSARESITIPATFIPPSDIKIGSYALEVMALSKKDPSIRESTYLRFDILSELPQLKVTIESSEASAPGEYEVNLILENEGSIGQNNISGVIKTLNQEASFSLDKIEAKATKLVSTEIFSIPSNAIGDHHVTVELYQNGKFFSEDTKPLSILPQTNLDILSDDIEKLLSFSSTVTITNIGNVPIEDRFSTSIDNFDTHFLSTTPIPLLRDAGGQTDLIWTFSLNPGESIILAYKVSYLPLALLIVLIIAGGFTYTKYFVNPYLVTKDVTKDPHGENALKINLHVKNNTRTDAEHARLMDVVPTPLKLIEDFGTIEPDVVKRKSGGANMLWELGSLASKEERVISYKVKSSMSVFGRLTIPSAKLKIKPSKGKSKLYRSNKVFLKGRVDIKEEE